MRLYTLLILAVGALAGCSSTPSEVDRGPIHARTFSFVDPGPKRAPGYADNTQPVHAMVQQSITKTFGSRGVSRVASGGDVTVGYLLIVGNNASTASIDEYFGYAEDATGLEDKAHKAYTSSKNPNYFEAGTLVIDVIDSKTFKLLKRGYATRPILQNPTNEQRAARIQEVVDEILANLRVEP